MKYDLKTPCKNCPFRTDETRIVFATRHRAEDIEEQAYRRGFPCHLSSEHVDNEDTFDGESGGFYATEDTQHCAGAIIMFIKQGETEWPGINNDDTLVDKLWDQMDMNAPVFECAEDFFKANEGGH